MAKVQLKKLNKSFGGSRVVRDLDLTVEDGAFTVLVGPSGCGKSTILRMIAGLEEADGGTVVINGKPVNDLEPARRNVAMVFQNYALYPHMTVYKNLAFPLRMRGEKKDQIDAKVREAAEILGIAEMLDRKPRTLSGGQMQRVALGRAIVRNPLVFLFDEPLSNLDAKMRVEMRAEIRRLHRSLGTTMIYVTHDQEEAMTMGSRIAVLDRGVLQQEGEPMEVYHRPANRFTAAFIGSPAMNFFDGAVLNGVFVHPGFRVLAEGLPDGPAVLGVRPHDIVPAGQEGMPDPDAATDAADPVDEDPEEDDTPYEEKEAYTESVEARVDIVEPLGSETQVHCIAGKTPFLVSLPGHHPLQKGQAVQLRFEPAKIHFFHADTGARIA